MTAHAFVNPPEDTPSEWTCSACSSVISAPEHVMAGEHVGCGGKVELRAVPTSALSAAFSEAQEIDALLEEAGVPDDPLAEINAAAIAEEIPTSAISIPTPQPRRRRMPTTRHSRMRTFRLVQPTETFEFEFIAGFFEDGAVGEVFIHADRQGAALSGFLDATGIMISMLLQYGVPLGKIIGKLKGMRFPPDGRVPLGGKGETVFVTSPLDLLARWLETLLPASQSPCP